MSPWRIGLNSEYTMGEFIIAPKSGGKGFIEMTERDHKRGGDAWLNLPDRILVKTGQG